MASRRASHSRETDTLRHCAAVGAAATLKDALTSQRHQDVQRDPDANSDVTALEVYRAQLTVCKRVADPQCGCTRARQT